MSSSGRTRSDDDTGRLHRRKRAPADNCAGAWRTNQLPLTRGGRTARQTRAKKVAPGTAGRTRRCGDRLGKAAACAIPRLEPPLYKGEFSTAISRPIISAPTCAAFTQPSPHEPSADAGLSTHASPCLRSTSRSAPRRIGRSDAARGLCKAVQKSSAMPQLSNSSSSAERWLA